MKRGLERRRILALSALCSLLLFTVACTDELVSETPGTKTVSVKLVPLLFLDDPQTVILTEDQRIIVDGDHTDTVEPGQRTKIRLYKSGRRFLCVEGQSKCWQIVAIPEEDDPEPESPSSPPTTDTSGQPTTP